MSVDSLSFPPARFGEDGLSNLPGDLSLSVVEDESAICSHEPPPTYQKLHSIVLAALGIITVSGFGAAVGALVGVVIAAFVTGAAIVAISSGVGAAIMIIVAIGVMIKLSCNHEKRKSLEMQMHELEFDSVNDARPDDASYIENSVLVTQDSVETTQWRLDLIDQAKQSIECCGNFCGGEIFREALGRMRAALEREPELKIHIISHSVLLESEDIAMIEELRAQYPERFELLVVGEHYEWSNHLRPIQLHWKLTVVDGKYFVVGGTGMQDNLVQRGDQRAKPIEEESCFDKFVYGSCRDMDVVGFGPSGENLRMAFFQQYALWESLTKGTEMVNRHTRLDPDNVAVFEELENHPRTIHHAPMKIVASSSNDPVNKNIQEYLDLINEAQENDVLTIANLNFNPDPTILNALQAAVARKVHLRVITNGLHDTSPFCNNLCAWSQRRHYSPLSLTHEVIEQGKDTLAPEDILATEIYEYQVPNVLFHTKAITLSKASTLPGATTNGDKAGIGSFNLSQRSIAEYELKLFFLKKEVVDAINQVIETSIPLSRLIPLEESKEYYSGFRPTVLGGFQHAILSTYAS
jgi:phosphatidylserine/phosphatidylglycerophosphate/cardiolipin synthase-like enzyme